MSVTSSIQLRRGTGTAVPSSLLEGELAINTDTGHLYYGSSGSDNVVSSSIGATRLFATEEIRLGGAPGTTPTGSISANLLTFTNVEDENLNFNMSAGTPSVANSASFLTSENGFGIVLDKDNQHDDRVFFVGHNNALPGLSNFAPLMEISESGAARFLGSITSSGDISASGGIYADAYYSKDQAVLNYSVTNDRISIGNKPTLIQGNLTASGDISCSREITGQLVSGSRTNINESVRSGEYFHLVQNASGSMEQDIKVKVLKITGARLGRIGSVPYTVFSAPGANKAIQITEVTMFVDGTGTGTNFPASGHNPERNKLSFYAVPNDGISNLSFVPMGSFQRNQVNGATGRDSIITKHVPVNQMRLAINGDIKLRYGQTAGNNASHQIHNSGSNSSSTVTADYYFKIKYRVIDTTKDFTPAHIVEGSGGDDTPITP